MAQQRVVLNAAARTQISALQAEKAARNPAQRKMDSRLVHRMKKQRGERIGAGLEQFEAKVKPSADGRELVDIKGTISEALLTSLRTGGAEIVSSVPRFGAVRAKVPLAQLEPLAARGDVQFVKPAARAFTNAGTFLSEGDKTHGADTARATFKATGRGVKVGVLSDSVDFLSMAQSTGDLGPVTVLPGQAGLGESGEGTAMLEIVHDVAPDAELFFASAFLGEAQFAQNILDLRKAGCDIIVDDVIYLDESPFMDGPVAQAADAVVADGALFFSSAGNEGNKNDNTSGTWEGDFVDGGEVGAPIGGSGRLHAFGVNNFNTALGSGAAAVFFWADAYGASSNDYDLYLLNSTGTAVLDSSTNPQDGTQDPLEFIDAPPSGARFVIVKSPDAQPRFLHLKNFRGRLSANTAGACVGHAASEHAIAVAAVDAGTSSPNPFTGGATNPVETFSADGPRRIFYFADGMPITPGNFSATGGIVRQKPDIAAADGVQTATPGFEIFFGTSAAAPHAAAIAALVWSYNRALSPAQVRAVLTSTALNIEGPGVDRDSGSGLVMAPAAIGAVSPGPIVSFVSANVTAESFTPANTSPDPGETVTISVTLRNIGAAPGAITARLLPGGGVSTPSGPQSYGTLAASGGQAARDFTFTANGPAGGILDARFAISSGSVSLGAITVPFSFGAAASPVQVTNSNPITINDNAAASPYPSQINISGVAGNVSKVTVTLRQLTHTQPGDLSLLLVSPSGRTAEFYKGAGFGNPVTNLTFTVDDAAVSSLPVGTLTSGTFRPGQYDAGRDPYTAPAPAGPYSTMLNTFNGSAPNGTWLLYAIDSYTGDIGAFNAGWSLNITPSSIATNGAGPDLSVLISPVATLGVGDTATFTVQVFNNGPASASSVTLNSTLPAELSPFSRTVSQGSGTISGQNVSVNFGTIASGASATLTLNCNALASGSPAISFTAGSSGADNNTANNTSSANVAIGRSNLAPSQLVLSTEAGTSTEAATFQAGQPLFVDFTVGNHGDGPASQLFTTQIFLDGVLRRTIPRAFPLSAGSSLRPVDVLLGPLTPGEHTLLVRTDAGTAVTESNEGDNEIVRIFTVQGPNLAPGDIVISNTAGTTTDTPLFQTTDAVFVDYALINDGDSATGVATTAQVFLDGNLVTTFNVPATLNAGQSTGDIDLPLGSLAPGPHTIRVVLDSGTALAETNETDNEFTKDFSVNAPPTIGPPIVDQGTFEDDAQDLINFQINDMETPVTSLTVTAISTNPDFQITIEGTGMGRSMTVTPAPDTNGSGTITVTVDDGTGGTASDSFVFTVTPVNDPPSFTGGPSQTVAEDAGAVTVTGWAQAISPGPANESDQTVYFDPTIGNPQLFAVLPAVSPDGTLTFTPAANAHGSATVSFRLFDSVGGLQGFSAPHQITITVTSVNDPPSFTGGSDVTVNEDAGPVTVATWATVISAGPTDESGQAVTFLVENNAPTLFSAAPAINAAGTLTFTPAPNANGQATVTVHAQDNGGASTNVPATFTITVTPVNDPPAFTLSGDLAVAQNAGAQNLASFITGISAGPADETAQTVSFAVGVGDSTLFSAQPTIAANGTLAFTPVPTASGSATVTVIATDSSGASSAPQTFQIAITTFVEEVGTYNGLARALDAADSLAAQAGAINITFNLTGKVTGKLQLGGARYSFKGIVGNDGKVQFGTRSLTPTLELRRRGQSSLSLLLQLDVSGDPGQLTGTVMDGATTFATVLADRTGYDARTNPAPAPLAGRYTILLPHRTGSNNDVPPSEYPQGDGVGTLTIKPSGAASLRGTLADGSKISASSALSADNRWPLYAVTDRKQGAIAGFVDFVVVGNASDALASGLLWHKPANPNAPRYRAGWPGGIFVEGAGARFEAIAGRSLLPGLGLADADGNVEFLGENGGLPVTLFKALRVDTKDRTTVVTRAFDNLRVSINRRTGLVSGRFVPLPGEKPVSFSGAILQSQLRAGGFFLGRKETGSISLTPDDTPGTP